MPHIRTASTAHLHRRRIRTIWAQKPSGKQLDLLVLAGCSCLMTLVYHPVVDALQPTQATAKPAVEISTQLSHARSNWGGPLHATVPREQEEIVEEE